jgi:hypothetical protein
MSPAKLKAPSLETLVNALRAAKAEIDEVEL